MRTGRPRSQGMLFLVAGQGDESDGHHRLGLGISLFVFGDEQQVLDAEAVADGNDDLAVGLSLLDHQCIFRCTASSAVCGSFSSDIARP